VLRACEPEGTSTLKKQVCFIPVFITLLATAASGFFALAQAGGNQHAVSQNVAAERILNVDELKNQVKQYHDCTCTCGCYAHDLDAQADRAIEFLRRRTAQKRPNEKLAIVLDIDETSLTNYQELLRSGFNYEKSGFNAWIDTAQAPAIPGTLRLYKEAQKLGVSVFFITGRPASQRAATVRNLEAQGYTSWQELILRPDSAASQSVTAYKSSMRGQIVAKGYILILNIGDQWSDLKGNPEAEFSVKYPDPFYLIP
jgi:acid phosphatase